MRFYGRQPDGDAVVTTSRALTTLKKKTAVHVAKVVGADVVTDVEVNLQVVGQVRAGKTSSSP